MASAAAIEGRISKYFVPWFETVVTTALLTSIEDNTAESEEELVCTLSKLAFERPRNKDVEEGLSSLIRRLSGSDDDGRKAGSSRECIVPRVLLMLAVCDIGLDNGKWEELDIDNDAEEDVKWFESKSILSALMMSAA